ncbi:MAG: type II toxin-antitoxin system HicB family antitoxin [Candidatus Peregrinibacteria bacterium]|nr:type II toxin-antitoxin system HicB family antitoxin [Candidatus Peregrinibacteria bacterium]
MTTSEKIIVYKEGSQYVAWCSDNGISSFGDTRQAAMDSLQEALELYYEDAVTKEMQKV